jgi:hypothetical protein
MLGSVSGAQENVRVQVRVEPALHRLEAEAWIQHPPASRFYLYKGLSVHQVIADGKRVPFRTDSSAAPLPFAPMATAVDVNAKDIQQLQVKYSGEISGIMAGVNMITPGLVELALYTAWFPEFQGSRRFTFKLRANLPQDFVTVTNGLKESGHVGHGRLITDWTSYKPGIDMVLLASPHFHHIAGGKQSSKVEIYYYRLPQEALKADLDGLVAGMKRLTSLYGPPQVKGTLRLVYSPRAGWGYSRIPLIIVSEERARREFQEADGEANNFHDVCHEMAHFWWLIADPATPNDWINEGLAEFTAFRLTEERFGPAFAEARLAEYKRHARQNKTTAAIAETTGDSPDREINRYDKAALMFIEAQHRFGEAVLDRLLKTVYARFAGTSQATTTAFLQEVEDQMGREAAAYFREELYRKPRPQEGQQEPAAVN